MDGVNKERLFIASCFALLVTSLTFGIRAGIMNELGVAFELNETELGWMTMMAFLGFPVATMVGGALYNSVGPRLLMWFAFGCHLLGLGLTIAATGFELLLISTFFVGFANGMVEAACNPLIADMYPDEKTTMLNRFHVWFPGGIAIGALVSKFMGEAGLSWQPQVGFILIPTIIYGAMIVGQTFPKSENIESDTQKNFRSMLDWLFILTAVCITLTATTELGTQQWIEKLVGAASGADPAYVLALVTGIMAVGRFFAGPLVHSLNPIGVLFASAIVTTVGIVMMSQVTGGLVYVAAILFAVGVCYFWPTIIGFTAEYMPDTGALGMSIMGGIGMFGLSIWQPIIGGWLDAAKKEAGWAKDLPAEELAQIELLAGQQTLDNIAFFPAILIVLFGFLYVQRKHLEKRVENGELIIDN
ncbi:MAG: MFS transporter [Bacteroidota bacterium]